MVAFVRPVASGMIATALFLLAPEIGISQGKPDAAPLANSADISADKLDVDHEKRTALFAGNVRASFRSFRVSCKRMSLRYTDAGKVEGLVASGSVKVTAKDATAEAETAELDSARGVLILTGSPILTKGPNRLEGARIEIALADGRVEVTKARGTFRLSEGNAP